MLHVLAAAVTVVLLAANPPPPPVDEPPADASTAPAPRGPIVGGHRIQPRASTSQTGPNASATSRDADEVERLYQELMHETPGPARVRSQMTPQ